MKQLKFALILIICLACCNSVGALELSEYGGWMIDDGFEMGGYMYTYPYNVQKQTNTNVTQEQIATYAENETHKGKYSVRLNLLQLNVGDSVGFVRTLHGAGLDMPAERTYVSYYVKGTNLTKEDIGLSFTYVKNGNGSRVVAPYDAYGVDDADENGWFKVWCIVPAIPDYNKNESGLIGPKFIKRNGGPTAIYIDDFKVCHLPEKIDFKERNIPANDTFDLDKIQATAYNKNDRVEDLPNSYMTKWEVLSGDATINGRNLRVGKTGEIILKGTFFDVSDEVKLYATSNVVAPVLKSAVTAGKPTETDGVYSVNVSNSGEGTGRAMLIITVYKDGRLDRIYTKSADVLPGQSIILATEKIATSTEDTVKVAVWDSIFGCISVR